MAETTVDVNGMTAKVDSDVPERIASILSDIHSDNRVPFDPIVHVPLRNGDIRILIGFDENESTVKCLLNDREVAFDDDLIDTISRLYF